MKNIIFLCFMIMQQHRHPSEKNAAEHWNQGCCFVDEQLDEGKGLSHLADGFVSRSGVVFVEQDGHWSGEWPESLRNLPAIISLAGVPIQLTQQTNKKRKGYPQWIKQLTRYENPPRLLVFSARLHKGPIQRLPFTRQARLHFEKGVQLSRAQFSILVQWLVKSESAYGELYVESLPMHDLKVKVKLGALRYTAVLKH